MSDRPALLLTRRLPHSVEARARRDYDCARNDHDRAYAAAELIARARGCDAVLCCPSDALSADVIAALDARVRVIASFSVGVDHIDLDAAGARGICCTNTPDVLSAATADVAMLCLLGAARRAREGMELLHADQWDGWRPTFLLGRQLDGMRLGIVGMGRVGRAFAERARGFGMEIHYHNRTRLAPAIECGAIYHRTLDSLLTQSEALSLHCPATPQSAGLLNAERIALLPRGAIVVNTARGALIDDDALIAALQSGQVRAAGLDVFNGEPDRIHPRYRQLRNVFALPHLGSATEQTREAMGMRALDNLDAFFRGERPADCVN